MRCAFELAVGPERFEPVLGKFVGYDEHRFFVGVESPVESEALASLVLAPQRDLQRLNILFVEKGGDELACRGFLKRHEDAQRLSAQFVRWLAQRTPQQSTARIFRSDGPAPALPRIPRTFCQG